MAFTGSNFPRISKETGIAYTRVRKLFMTRGRLGKALKEYRASQTSKMQESADSVIEKAKQDMAMAYQQMRDLSKNASTDGGLFKANEFLLTLAGVTVDGPAGTVTGPMLDPNRQYESIKAWGAHWIEELKRILKMPNIRLRVSYVHPSIIPQIYDSNPLSEEEEKQEAEFTEKLYRIKFKNDDIRTGINRESNDGAKESSP